MNQPQYKLRIVATKMEFKHLQPGDLFSTLDAAYWAGQGLKMPAAQALIRTESESDDDPNETVYKLTVVAIDPTTHNESMNRHARNAEFSPYVPPGVSAEDWRKS